MPLPQYSVIWQPILSICYILPLRRPLAIYARLLLSDIVTVSHIFNQSLTSPLSPTQCCAWFIPDWFPGSLSIFSHPHSFVIINGSTFWSDKAYIRYSHVTAFKQCDRLGYGQVTQKVGGVYKSGYVEVSSSDISSLCGWAYQTTSRWETISLPWNNIGRISRFRRAPGILAATHMIAEPSKYKATPRPYNWDDVLGPIPASAYQCTFSNHYEALLISTLSR